jgi:hypothetical protein
MEPDQDGLQVRLIQCTAQCQTATDLATAWSISQNLDTPTVRIGEKCFKIRTGMPKREVLSKSDPPACPATADNRLSCGLAVGDNVDR